MQEIFSFGRIYVICRGKMLSTCSPSQRTGFGTYTNAKRASLSSEIKQ